MKSGKDWRKREKDLMKKIGVRPQPMSGAGWMKKEDGENEHFLVQLKSTEGLSIQVKLKDVEELIKNAMVSNKTPIFVLDFASINLQLFCVQKSEIEKIMQEYKQKEENITLADLL